MRIGICTTDFDTLPARELFARIARLGFECVQFSFATVTEAGFEAGPALEIPPAIAPETVAAVKAAAGEYGLPVVAVNGTFNMAHPDESVRAEGVRRFEILAEATAALDCPIISLCSGTRNRESLWKPHPDNLTESAWRDSVDTAKKLCRIAEEKGLTLAVETEASNVVCTPEKARSMMDEIGSPALKMILDPANLFLPGTAKKENAAKSLYDAFAAFGGDIVIAHGKDIREGEGIDFCGTGLGIVNFPLMLDLLRRAGFKGDWTLHGIYDEADMPRALEYARRIKEELRFCGC